MYVVSEKYCYAIRVVFVLDPFLSVAFQTNNCGFYINKKNLIIKVVKEKKNKQINLSDQVKGIGTLVYWNI